MSGAGRTEDEQRALAVGLAKGIVSLDEEGFTDITNIIEDETILFRGQNSVQFMINQHPTRLTIRGLSNGSVLGTTVYSWEKPRTEADEVFGFDEGDTIITLDLLGTIVAGKDMGKEGLQSNVGEDLKSLAGFLANKSPEELEKVKITTLTHLALTNLMTDSFPQLGDEDGGMHILDLQEAADTGVITEDDLGKAKKNILASMIEAGSVTAEDTDLSRVKPVLYQMNGRDFVKAIIGEAA